MANQPAEGYDQIPETVHFGVLKTQSEYFDFLNAMAEKRSLLSFEFRLRQSNEVYFARNVVIVMDGINISPTFSHEIGGQQVTVSMTTDSCKVNIIRSTAGSTTLETLVSSEVFSAFDLRWGLDSLFAEEMTSRNFVGQQVGEVSGRVQDLQNKVAGMEANMMRMFNENARTMLSAFENLAMKSLLNQVATTITSNVSDLLRETAGTGDLMALRNDLAGLRIKVDEVLTGQGLARTNVGHVSARIQELAQSRAFSPAPQAMSNTSATFAAHMLNATDAAPILDTAPAMMNAREPSQSAGMKALELTADCVPILINIDSLSETKQLEYPFQTHSHYGLSTFGALVKELPLIGIPRDCKTRTYFERIFGLVYSEYESWKDDPKKWLREIKEEKKTKCFGGIEATELEMLLTSATCPVQKMMLMEKALVMKGKIDLAARECLFLARQFPIGITKARIENHFINGSGRLPGGWFLKTKQALPAALN